MAKPTGIGALLRQDLQTLKLIDKILNDGFLTEEAEIEQKKKEEKK